MRVLVFDTETTGLAPKGQSPSYSNVDKFPHIVQFSYIFYDTETMEIVQKNDNVIKIPLHIVIGEESTKIHGITNEISRTSGIDIQTVLSEFMCLFSIADLVVAHNLEFDKNMLIVELLRLPQTEANLFSIGLISSHKKYYCTMQEGMYLCNIKKTYVTFVTKETKEYIKFPSLFELYKHLFNEEPVNLHNSFNDIVACLRCFHKIKFDEDICEKNAVFAELQDLIR
jgi:DNA polymerase-3 subunit epsilon